MLRCDFESIQNNQDYAKDMASDKEKLGFYLESLLAKQVGFLSCIDDDVTIQQIIEFVSHLSKIYSKIVVLGIGGSALGAKMLRDALLPIEKRDSLLILDTIDPSVLTEVTRTLPLEETLFLVISKSGTTQETIAQYYFFQELLQVQHLSLKEHIVMITDNKKGCLRKEAEIHNLPSFCVPTSVGGRFSVLTAVGLVPAALMGVDIKKLLLGAQQMRENAISPSYEKNIAFQIASLQYCTFKNNKNIHVLFPYSEKLRSFAAWWQQLLAESIGKNPTVGITPLTSLGPTDQHSLLQLYHDGPRDKCFLFIEVEDTGSNLRIPEILEASFSYLSHGTFEELLKAEKQGTMTSLVEQGHPVCDITLPRIDETSLGELIFLMEMVIGFLGELFEINAFDQPGVERGKLLGKEAFVTSQH